MFDNMQFIVNIYPTFMCYYFIPNEYCTKNTIIYLVLVRIDSNKIYKIQKVFHITGNAINLNIFVS